MLGIYFDRYYESNDVEEKKRLRKLFSKHLWESIPYEKGHRSFRFDVVDTLIEDEAVRELFKPYQRITYKILKSRHNINKLEKLDLVKARINSNYGVYCDRDIYLGKEYYKYLGHIRNIYFNYIDGKYKLVEEVKNEVNDTYQKAMQLKEEAQLGKLNMSWDEYQQFIEKCLDRIFENYIPIAEHPKIDWQENDHFEWDEDNGILSYVNSSLNGYLKNYIRDSNKLKEKSCVQCGTTITQAKTNQKYCNECKSLKKRKPELRCSQCGIKIDNPKPRQRFCELCRKEKDKQRHKRYNKTRKK
ncbi:hypothetical protein [Clostridium butyricum]|uniref:Uncharacterized protein n=1 Tax=Clostridium butyricum TaxID=1492 RepID=A0AAP9UDH1_CLOBU|nr:hypothetical protein [Clostridium butyricum]MBZ5746253.1 hypothetical protein [Clostridium butyricum]MDI9210081.1 hypothetical protein [Clostridium butyricum]QMW90140.1 hypothetical protein FF104_04000 [Clostridium butyricum]BBK77777.1 hypothetical protein Cbu04g_27850 [Clostridium butyricum]GEQ24749.1 hypothetical protein CBU03nite_11720 [Clostridium butyricum]